MAPGRSCDRAFAHIEMQVSLAYSTLFFLVFSFIFATLFFVRKRSSRAGKTLVGTAYISAVVMMLISNILDIVSYILVVCEPTDQFTYSSMAVALNILYALSKWCLLFVAVYILNNLLTQSYRLSTGQQTSPVAKSVPLAVVTVMLLLICADEGLWGYINITREAGRPSSRGPTYENGKNLSLAVQAMYLLSVCAGAVLAGLSVMKMRARRAAGGGLIVWVAVLFFFMLLWNILSLIRVAEYLRGIAWNVGTELTFVYLQGAFRALAFVALLVIAKHPSWESMEHAVQQEYAPMGQQYATTQDHYQPPGIYEAPVHIHAK